jgi:hypothetical protein
MEEFTVVFSISSSHFTFRHPKLTGLFQDGDVQRVSCEQTDGFPTVIKCGEEVLECLRNGWLFKRILLHGVSYLRRRK